MRASEREKEREKKINKTKEKGQTKKGGERKKIHVNNKEKLLERLALRLCETLSSFFAPRRNSRIECK